MPDKAQIQQISFLNMESSGFFLYNYSLHTLGFRGSYLVLLGGWGATEVFVSRPFLCAFPIANCFPISPGFRPLGYLASLPYFSRLP